MRVSVPQCIIGMNRLVIDIRKVIMLSILLIASIVSVGQSVLSITRVSSQHSNAASVDFTVIFDVSVTGISTSNFLPVAGVGISGSSVSNVSGSGASYTVTVLTGTGDDNLGLEFNNSAGLSPTITNTGYTSEESYTIDKTPPEVLSSNNSQAGNPVEDGSGVGIRVTFSESVSGVSNTDFIISYVTGSGASLLSPSSNGDNTIFLFPMLSGSGDKSFTVDFDADAAGGVTDLAGNVSTVDFTSGETIVIDQTFPGAPTTGTVAVTGGTVTAGEWDSDNTGIDVDVPVASDASLEDGYIQIQANVESEGWVDVGSAYTILLADIPSTKTLSITGSEFESLSGGLVATEVVQFRGVIADAAGNATDGTTSADDVTVLSIGPYISSIVRASAAAERTNGSSVTFTVTFNENVNNVDGTDFIVAGTSTGGSVNSVSPASPASVYDVNITGITGDGTVSLDISGSTDIQNTSTDPYLGEVYSEEQFIVDTDPPALRDIERQTPSSLYVDGSTDLEYWIRFDEAMSFADLNNASNFTITPGNSGTNTTATITSITQVADILFEVIISGGNLSTFNDTVDLDLAAVTNFVDLAGNTIGSVVPSQDDEFYIVDNTAPSISSFTRLSPNAGRTNVDNLVFQVAFDEGVSGVDISDFEISGTTATIANLNTVSSSTYNLTVNGGDLSSLNDTVRIDTATSRVIQDLAGNNLQSVAPGTKEEFIIDNTAPTVVDLGFSEDSIFESTSSWTFDIGFSEPMRLEGPVPSLLYSPDISSSLSQTGGSWTGDSVYRYTYDVIGSEDLDLISITVSDAQDSAGNVVNSRLFSDTLYLDRLKPSVASIVVSIDTIADGTVSVPGVFSVVVNYDEDMDKSVAPVISYPGAGEDPLGANATLLNASGSWTGNQQYTFTYDLADVDTTIWDIDIRVTGGLDSIGNVQLQADSVDAFNIDTKNPEVVDLVVSIDTIADGTVSVPGVFSVVVNYDEDMDKSVAPVISYPGAGEDPLGANATLLNASGSWTGNQQYTFTYDLADVDTTIWDIDIRVTGGLDSIGNVQLQADSVDAFNIDTKNPEVVDLVVSIDTIADGTVSVPGVFSVVVNYDEDMDKSVAPVISYPGTGEDPLGANATLLNASGSWTGNQQYTFTYDLADVDTTIWDIDIRVTGGLDSIGNVQLQADSVDAFNIDTKNPEVVDLVVSIDTIADGTVSVPGVFSVVVNYGEDMDKSVAPVISYPGAGEDPLGANATLLNASGSWTGNQQYTFTYDLADVDTTIWDIDIRVTGGLDSIGNVQLQADSVDAFNIDTKNPEVVDLVVSIDTIADGTVSVPGVFSVVVNYDEDMDKSVAPVISYPGAGEDPLGANATLLNASGSWTGNQQYTFTYDLADVDTTIWDIDIRVTGGLDSIGNVQLQADSVDAFNIDTKNPEVVDLVVSIDTIADGTVSVPGVFSVVVNYDEDMDKSVAPVISYPGTGEDPLGANATLLNASGSWTGNQQYTFTYDLADVDTTIWDIDIRVTGGLDSIGNVQLQADSVDAFNIDTKNPEVVDLVVSIDTIADGTVSVPGVFSVVVNYGEDMDKSVAPVISYPGAGEDPLGANATLLNASGSWTGNQQYTFTYDLADVDTTIWDIDIRVTGGLDSIGNVQLQADSVDAFNIDTKNPEVIGLSVDIDTISDSDDTNTFTISITYDEEMDRNFVPPVSFPDENALVSGLTASGGSWFSSTRYDATYTISDQDTLLQDIDVQVDQGTARDSIGNIQTANGLFTDVFDIDTENPEVIGLSVDIDTISDSDDTNTFTISITYDEEMDRNFVPPVSFPDENALVSGLTASGGSWFSSTRYDATYTISDQDTLLQDIDVQVDQGTARDSIGNIQTANGLFTDVFDIDTENPEVIGLSVDIDTISDSDDTNTFTISITYDEEMDRNFVPPVSFPDENALVSGLTASGGSWFSSTRYDATYTISDQDTLLQDIDVQVDQGTARDSIGNIQTANGLFTDVFDIDTENPEVIGLSVDIDTISDSDDTNTFTISITYDEEMDRNFVPPVSFPDENALVSGLTASGGSWFSSTRYDATYTISDQDTLLQDIDVQVDQGTARDSIGNIQTANGLFTDVFDIDTENPEVIGLSVDIDTISDSDDTNTFTISITYDEEMDRNFVPPVSFPDENALVSGLTASGGSWFSSTRYDATYTISDQDTLLQDIDVQVDQGTARDSIGNIQTANGLFTDVFDIDTENPEVIGLSVDIDTISDSDDTNTFTISITYDEEMDRNFVPPVSFPDENALVSGLTASGGSWFSSTRYDATYTISDQDTLLQDIDVQVDQGTARDSIGNIQTANGLFTDVFDIDTENPEVIGLSVDIDTISDSDDTNTFTISITYDEEMDRNFVPPVSFPDENALVSGLTASGGSWFSSTRYDATYTISDQDTLLQDIDVQVDQGTARDSIGNIQTANGLFTDVFDIDTENPEVIGLSVDIDTISDSDDTNTFTISITYDEEMDRNFVPPVSFPDENALVSGLTASGGSWFSSTRFDATYTISDQDTLLQDIDVQVDQGTARDSIGNIQTANGLFTDVFDIDTENPEVIGLSVDIDTISDSDDTNTFTISITYDEEMDRNFVPPVSFPDENALVSGLTASGGSWFSSTRYDATYTISDQDTLLQDIDVQVDQGTARDSIGNIQTANGLFTDVFDIDTENPEVIGLSVDIDTISDSDDTNTFTISITYDEEMDRNFVPPVSFPDGNALVSGLTASGGSWFSSTRYDATYTISDQDTLLQDIDVQVDQGTARDSIGNIQTANGLFTDVFDIDTENPEVIGLSVDIDTISDSDDTNTFTISITYDEEMDRNFVPPVSFPDENALVSGLTASGGSWFSSTRYDATYTISDQDTLLQDIDVQVDQGTARDSIGNIQTANGLFTDVFDIDTENPEVIGLSVDIDTISDSDDTNTFTISITYDEEMDRNFVPPVSFPDENALVSGLTASGGSWFSSTRYDATYTISDQDTLLQDIDVQVDQGTARDSIGNIQTANGLFTDVFDIDTDNPEVIGLSVDIDTISDSDDTNTFTISITYDEEMDRNFVPPVSFPDENALVSGLTASGGSWFSSTRYDATYTISDQDTLLQDIDVQVDQGTARDSIGNIQTANGLFTDVFDIDTENPEVIGLSVDIDTISDSDDTNTFTISLTYDEEMDRNFVPPVSFPDENALVSGLTASGGSWFSSTRYDATYTISDQDTLLQDIDVQVDQGTARDSIGNIQTANGLFTDVFDIDTENPEVIGLSVDIDTISDSDDTNTFTISITYDEEMDRNFVPPVSFPDENALVSGLTASGGSWFSSTRYDATYTISDQDTLLQDIDVQVDQGTARDSIGNIQTANGLFTDVFDIDTENPEVIGLSVDIDTISDSDDTNTFTISITYDEEMDRNFVPPVSFPGENALVSGLTASGGSWFSSTRYDATYTISDQDTLLQDIDVQVDQGTARDSIGNIQTANGLFTDVFDIDTENPEVIGLSVDIDTIADSDVGNTFTISITYDEDMDRTTVPQVSFPVEDPLASGLTLTGGTWVDARQYDAEYSIADSDTLLQNIDIQVDVSGGATDSIGNAQQSDALFTNVFDIDTENPEVIGLSVDIDTISDSDDTNTFTISITYDEEMDRNFVPPVSFPDENALVSGLTASGGSWFSSTRYDATYTISDQDTLLQDIDVQVDQGTARDSIGNIQTANGLFTDVFDIDTENPEVIGLSVDIDTISDSDDTNTFTISITYDEEMDRNFVPPVSFPGENALVSGLTASGGSWFSSTRYDATYTISDQDTLLQDIDVQVDQGTARDSIGNIQTANGLFTDVFDIDTENPEVIGLSVDIDTIADSDVGNTFTISITYDEDMDRTTVPQVSFPVEDPLASGLTLTGGTWVDARQYDAEYSIADSDTLLQNIDIQVDVSGGATDSIGNAQQSDALFTNVFDIDTDNPEVIGLSVDIDTISDSDNGQPFMITLDYSEPMDRTSVPSIIFPTLNGTGGDPIDSPASLTFSNGMWSDADTYVATYTISDQDTLIQDIDIRVETGPGNALDSIGNEQEVFEALDVFDIDTENPEVIGLSVDIDTISDSDNGQPFMITLDYSEPMDRTSVPSIIFPTLNGTGGDPIDSPASLTFSNGVWSDADTYVATYTISDQDTLIQDIDIRVETGPGNALDSIGNEQEVFEALDVFDIDTKNPEVIGLSVDIDTIADSDVGNTFTISITYDEDMDRTTVPQVSFPVEDPLASGLTLTGGSWVDARQYDAEYSIADSDTLLQNIDIQVDVSGGATDSIGNAQQSDALFTNVFDIDTENPEVIGLSVDIDTISDSDNGQPFMITLDYSEPMDRMSVPSIIFPTLNGTGGDPIDSPASLTFSNGVWSDADTYVATYTISDQDTLIQDIDIRVETGPGNALDSIGNEQEVFEALDVFDIDTDNPEVIGLSVDIDTISDSDNGQPFMITLDYSEPMDRTSVPSIIFPTLNGTGGDPIDSPASLTFSNGVWSDADTYVATYTISDQDTLIQDIDIRVETGPGNALDSIGNEQEVFEALDVFDIDTKNPEVIGLSVDIDTIADSDVGNTFTISITYDEDMDRTTVPQVSFPVEDPLASGLTLTGGTWVDARQYDAEYSIADSDTLLQNIDIQVDVSGGATDSIGNAQQSDALFTNVFDIDTENPEVIGLSVDIDTISDGDNGQPFMITLDYSEPMDRTSVPSIIFPTLNGTGGDPIDSPASLTFSNGVWSDADTYVATYTISDQDTLIQDIDIRVETGPGNALDSIGNEQEVFEALDVFDIDTENPEVIGLSVDIDTISDSDNGQPFMITLDYSEPMDRTSVPSIIFPTLNGTGGDPIDSPASLTFSNGVWSDADTYVATYTISDQDTLIQDIDIRVETGPGNALDSIGNEQEVFEALDVFDIDTENPEVIGLSVDIDTISDSDNGQPFMITLDYSEPMDRTSVPSIIFPTLNGTGGDPIDSPASLTFSNGVWSDADTYVATYTISDQDTLIQDIDIRVETGPGNALDSIGNEQEVFEALDVFDIDTKNPEVIGLSVDIDTIADSDVGNTFTISITYDEDMDRTTVPQVSFPVEDPLASGLTLTGGTWVDARQYDAEYSIADSDTLLQNIDIQVDVSAGATDSIGNAQQSDALFTNVFDIDTENPEVIGLSVDIDTISDGDNGQPFMITLDYSEPMDRTSVPSIIFPTLNGTGGDPIDSPASLTFSNGVWSDADTYVATYTISDQDTLIQDIDIRVETGPGNALDSIGNEQEVFEALDVFDIDTDNPEVIGLSVDIDTISDSDNGQPFMITLDYSEPMDRTSVPSIIFPTLNGTGGDPIDSPASLTFSNGVWSDADTYVATYTISDQDTLIQDIDIRVETGPGNALDSIGNEQEVFEALDVFDIDTKNPEVIGLSVDIDTIADSDVGNTFTISITYDEDMDRTTVPQVSFPVEDPLASGLTLTGGTWVDARQYDAEYSIADSDTLLQNIDIQVDVSGGATDSIGNAQQSDALFTNVFDIDTENPEVIGLSVDIDTISDSDNGQPFMITLDYSEPMDRMSVPSIIFPTLNGTGGDPIDSPASLTFSNGVWSDADTYVATYTISDQDTLIQDIDIRVETGPGNALDSIGNEQEVFEALDVFDIDTENPEVVGLVVDIDTIADSDVGNTFTISITYDEDMDRTTVPQVSFPVEDPLASGLTLTGGTWVDARQYDAEYSIADSDTLLQNIDIQVDVAGGATDSIGNAQQSDALFTDVFDIDTKNPVITEITVSIDTISDSDVGNSFIIGVIYDEDMDRTTVPQIVFPDEDPLASGLTLTGAVWLNSREYDAIYSIADSDTLLQDIDVRVNVLSGATDSIGNAQESDVLSGDLFDIDTENPEVLSISISNDTLNDASSSFSVTINYSEAMDRTSTPSIVFPSVDVGSAGLNYSSGVWNDGDTYTADYSFTDLDTFLVEVDIRIETSSATDSIGNGQIQRDTVDVFTIDTENPMVTISDPSADSTLTGPVSFTITYTDEVGIDTIKLVSLDVTVDSTRSSNSTVAVTGTGLSTRTVTLDNIGGVGDMRILIPDSTAYDISGNAALISDSSKIFRAQKILTLKSDSTTKVYGEPNPSLAGNFEYIGFQGDDDENVLQLLPVIEEPVTDTSNVGFYTITLSEGYDPYYRFVEATDQGAIEITKDTLYVIPVDTSRFYGDTLEFYPLIYSTSTVLDTLFKAADTIRNSADSLFNNNDNLDSIDVLPVAFTETNRLTNAGQYQVLIRDFADSNYFDSLVFRELEIKKAPLEVTADTIYKIYGEVNPVLTFSYDNTGFKNGQDSSVIDRQPFISTTADQLSSIGSYPITFLPGLDTNYQINTTGAALVVEKAPLIIQISSIDRVIIDNPEDYIPEFTFNVDAEVGFRNDDTPEVLDVPPFRIELVDENDPYVYDILFQGDVEATNYNIEVRVGKLFLFDSTSIIQQPIDLEVCGADPLTFDVQGEGEFTVTYEWEFRESADNFFRLASENEEFFGGTSDRLFADSVRADWDGYEFRATVSSDFGPDVVSDVVRLAVKETPPITYLSRKNSQMLVGVYNNDEATYQWKRNGEIIPGENQQYFKSFETLDLAEDIYSLEICIGSCCIESVYGQPGVIPPGEEDIPIEEIGLTVGPNPSDGAFTVNWSNPFTGEYMFRVIDTNGDEILSQLRLKGESSTEFSVDLNRESSDFTSGIYFIVIYFDNQITTQKIFIVR